MFMPIDPNVIKAFQQAQAAIVDPTALHPQLCGACTLLAYREEQSQKTPYCRGGHALIYADAKEPKCLGYEPCNTS
jgi:hypothetical protein